MSMEVKIHKKLGEYELDVYWKSKKKRIGILGASGSGKSLTLKALRELNIRTRAISESESISCMIPIPERV